MKRSMSLLLLLGLSSEACGRPSTSSLPPAPSPAPASTAQQPRVCSDDVVVREFQRIWYDSRSTWRANQWLGIPTEQNPMDVWIMQEMIFETKPDFVIECGAFLGGSAALWGMLLGQVNPAGRVISIDIRDRLGLARSLPIVKQKVDFLIGSSTSPRIVAEIEKRVKGKKVLVLLDSDHRKAHVLEELKAYSRLVQIGGYIVVQDTNINGHPVAPEFGAGPFEAVQEFMVGNTSFVVDKNRERLLIGNAPGGYLKRVR